MAPYNKRTSSYSTEAVTDLRDRSLRPSSQTVETVSRLNVDTVLALTSTTLHLTACSFRAGTLITNITVMSGGTGATTPTAQWFALFDSARVKLQVTNDDGSTAWAANTAKTLTLASPFRTTYTGLHYIGVCVVAAVAPPIVASGGVSAALTLLAPALSGSSTTGLAGVGTCPATAAALTGAGLGTIPYITVA